MRRILGALGLAALAVACKSVPLHAQPFGRAAREPGPQGLFEVEWRIELVGPRLWESQPREPARPAVDPDTGRERIFAYISPQKDTLLRFIATEEPGILTIGGVNGQEKLFYDLAVYKKL